MDWIRKNLKSTGQLRRQFTQWQVPVELREKNGTPQRVDYVLLFTVEPRTWDEAMAIRNLRLGWEPYQPAGESQNCPRCSSNYWPESYGECWNCGHTEAAR